MCSFYIVISLNILAMMSQVGAYKVFPEGGNYVMTGVDKNDFSFGGDTGLANWDSFLFYFYRLPQDPALKCLAQGLEVNFRTPTGDYLPAVRLMVGCHINRDNLNNIIFKRDDNTLIFRLEKLKCYRTSFFYKQENRRETVGRYNRKEFYCDSWDAKNGPTSPDAKATESIGNTGQCAEGPAAPQVQPPSATPASASSQHEIVPEDKTPVPKQTDSPPPPATAAETTTVQQADQTETTKTGGERGRRRYSADELF